MAHYIAYYGPLATARRRVLRLTLAQPTGGPFVMPQFDPKTIDLTVVAPSAIGPRCESMTYGKTIPWGDGGDVRGVDHTYIDGYITDKTSIDYANLAKWGNTFILLCSDYQYREEDDFSGAPVLSKGGLSMCLSRCKTVSKGKVLEVTFTFNCVCKSKQAYDNFSLLNFNMYVTFEVSRNNKNHMPQVHQISKAPRMGYLTYWTSPVVPRFHMRINPPTITVTCTFLSSNIGGTIVNPLVNWDPKVLFNQEYSRLHRFQIDQHLVRDCTLEAIEDCKFTDSVSLENMSDILKSVETAKGFFETGMDIVKFIKTKNPMILVRLVAQAHLIYRYVFKTTIKDASSLIRLGKLLWAHRAEWMNYLSHSRGRCDEKRYVCMLEGRPYTVTCNLRLDMQPAQFQLLEYARLAGLSPSLVDFWDIVPLSFVVDWLLPVGDTIDGVTALKDLSYTNSLHVQSFKLERPITLLIDGTYQLTGYSRRYLRKVSRSYSGSLVPSFRIKNPFKNFWTGVALLLSSLKTK